MSSERRAWPLSACGLLVAGLLAGRAAGDSGAVLSSEPAGPFTITVFAAPEPVVVGTADVSVLVQTRPGGAPVLDAAVSLELAAPGFSGPPGAAQVVPATRALATNKLLYAAPVALPAPGAWRLRVAVRRGDDAAEVACALPVAPLRRGLGGIWPYLVIPPLAVALFVLRQSLARRRRLTPARPPAR